jgi:amidase
MAHGNDGGGSIRIPASCCGLFGLKPTRGRNPLGPDFGDLMSGLVAEHALTRSVRDSATLLDATAGPDAGDPYWAPPPTRPYLQEVGADPGRLKIAFSTQAAGDVAVHADCVQAVEEAARLCAELGHDVEEATLQLNSEILTHAFVVMWSAGVASTLKLLGATRDQVEPLSWALKEMGDQFSAADYILAVQTLQGTGREVARFFQNYDVLLTPTLAEPPLSLGTFDALPDYPLHGFTRSATFACFTPLCNMTGQPGMSVPLFWNADNLPVGSHFIGRFGDEATLFRLAAQLEEAWPWAGRRPVIG